MKLDRGKKTEFVKKDTGIENTLQQQEQHL
jgi:hypothetical protein